MFSGNVGRGNGIGAKGTTFANKVLPHVDVSEFLVGDTFRPIDGAFVVVPDASGLGAVGQIKVVKRNWSARSADHPRACCKNRQTRLLT